MQRQIDSALPIGVFDSGVGGLTVLRALRARLPHENLIYLGDTARLPYGTKSKQTVSRYAAQAAAKLVERQVKMLVIACNTATAAALDHLRELWPDLPVVGVVEPGAKAACAASRSGSIAVIATESTINNQAYQKAIRQIRGDAKVSGQPCSLFVSLAEEGWLEGEIVEAVARRYLASLFNKEAGAEAASDDHGNPDCLLLGCTHFPPLAQALANVLTPGVRIVDSAETTAQEVERKLAELGALNPQACEGNALFLTTDDVERFSRTGAIFLGAALPPGSIELVNL